MAGDELRVGGGVALAVGLRADVERRAAVLVEGDRRRLGAGKGTGLDIGGEADAADPAGALGRRQARLEALPVGDLDGAVEMAGELAAVIDAAALRLVGQLAAG